VSQSWALGSSSLILVVEHCKGYLIIVKPVLGDGCEGQVR
jgi:hypothetical protein